MTKQRGISPRSKLVGSSRHLQRVSLLPSLHVCVVEIGVKQSAEHVLVEGLAGMILWGIHDYRTWFRSQR